MMKSCTWAGSYFSKVPDYGVQVTHRLYTRNWRVSSEGYTAQVKQRLKTQTLVQNDTVSSSSLLKTNRKTSCGPVVWGRTHCNTAESHCSWKFPGPWEKCQWVTLVLNTAEMTCACWEGITVRDCAEWSPEEEVGYLQGVVGSLDWGCREKELSQREQVLFQLEYIHDGIVQLSEHHKVDGKAGGTVLGGRIAREPRQSVVLLQNKPARENT